MSQTASTTLDPASRWNKSVHTATHNERIRLEGRKEITLEDIESESREKAGYLYVPNTKTAAVELLHSQRKIRLVKEMALRKPCGLRMRRLKDIRLKLNGVRF